MADALDLGSSAIWRGSSNLFARTSFTSGSDSVVECDLAKVEVAGSNPVARSIDSAAVGPRRRGGPRPDVALTQHQGRGTQVVRERSAKPLCAGSNPARASKNILIDS